MHCVMVYLLSHIHKNTVLSDEHIVGLQSSLQFLPARRPVVALQGLEEQFSEWSDIMLSAVCLCADKTVMSSYSED